MHSQLPCYWWSWSLLYLHFMEEDHLYSDKLTILKTRLRKRRVFILYDFLKHSNKEN
jgi:hypothetical protein